MRETTRTDMKAGASKQPDAYAGEHPDRCQNPPAGLWKTVQQSGTEKDNTKGVGRDVHERTMNQRSGQDAYQVLCRERIDAERDEWPARKPLPEFDAP